MRPLRSLFETGLLALAIGAAGPAAAAEINGTATKVIDGDTFQLDGVAIRLCGIDAPEDGQNGARESARFLAELVEGRAVRCVVVGGGTPCDGRSKATSRNRIVAQCFVDGRDLAAELTAAGHACDWPKFSAGAYSKANCSR